MGIHVNGVYVVGLEGNEKGNIIRIYSYGLGYYHYHTIKDGNHRCDKFMEDSPFGKSLVYYGFDYCPVNLKGNEEEDNMDEKIVVLRNGKAVTATKYANGKKINSAIAKCHPDDKFNFNVGAKIAVGRLVGENDNTDEKALDKTLGEAKEGIKQNIDILKRELHFNDFIDDFISDFWDNFKKGRVQVRVTYKNIEYFLRVAESKEIKWWGWRNATALTKVLKEEYLSTASGIYIGYNHGMLFSLGQLKNKTVVDWDEILPLLPRRTVYSNDFSWDKFLNGEIVAEVLKEDSFYFFWHLCSVRIVSNLYDFFENCIPFPNFVSTLNKNDLVWCKMKDGKLVFRKAHDRSFGLSPTIFIYKYNGKRF